MIDREILVSEFLEKLETCFDLDGETQAAIKKCWVEFDKDKAHNALDRLFSDLRDFCGEIYADKGQTHETTLSALSLKKRKGKVK